MYFNLAHNDLYTLWLNEQFKFIYFKDNKDVLVLILNCNYLANLFSTVLVGKSIYILCVKLLQIIICYTSFESSCLNKINAGTLKICISPWHRKLQL